MADPYTTGINSKLAFGNLVSFDKEIVVPEYDTTDEMNAYIPARAGALSQVGTDMYRWDGAAWQLIGSGTGSGSYRGLLSDL